LPSIKKNFRGEDELGPFQKMGQLAFLAFTATLRIL
jgi:hypothetical protein